RLRRVALDEAPLHAGRESGASTPAQPRGLDLVGDGRRLHLEQRLAQRGVAAFRLVDVDLVQAGRAEVPRQHVAVGLAVRTAKLSHRPSSSWAPGADE